VTLQTGTTLITLARGARARLINGKDALQGELLTGEILVRPEGETEAVVKTPFGTARSKGKAFRIAVDLTGMDVTALGNDVRLTCGGQTTVMRKEDRKRVGNASLSLPDLPDVAARKPGPGVVFTPNARSEKPSPLPVEDLTVHVIFDGPFVCTRVDQTFVNETNCGRKGSFTFPLPKGASVSRVAVWPKGKSLIEGEIVEKNHGRRFYDAAVRNRRDLTLWGWRKGNLFRVQDVEIAARSHTRILLEYRQILSRRNGHAVYRFPLASHGGRGNRLGRFSMQVEFEINGKPSRARVSPIPNVTGECAIQSGAFPWRLEVKEIAPEADFRINLEYPVLNQPRWIAHRLPTDKKGYFLVALPPAIPPDPRKSDPLDLLLCVDTSLSRAGLAHRLQVHAVAYLLGQLGPEDRFRLLSFDASVREIGPPGFRTASAPEKTRALRWLADMVPLGASNLEKALDTVRSALAPREPGRRRVGVLLSDGTPTLGKKSPADLKASLEALDRSAGTPLHGLALGLLPNPALLNAITKGTGGTFWSARNGREFDRSLFALSLSIASGPVREEGEIPTEGTGISQLHECFPEGRSWREPFPR
jgi:hypothetical protein